MGEMLDQNSMICSIDDQSKPINPVGDYDKDLSVTTDCKLSDRINEEITLSTTTVKMKNEVFRHRKEKNCKKKEKKNIGGNCNSDEKNITGMEPNSSNHNTHETPSVQLHMDSVEFEDNTVPFRAQSRNKVFWSREETNALIRHVESHGFQWRKILDENQDDFSPSRRIIDLKNKYNMITKSNTFYTTPKRNWVEIVDGEPKRDSMGEIICVIDRFPYNAAKKLAKAQRFSGYESYTMYIADEADLEKLHIYTVTVTQDTYNVKKMKRESE